MTNLSRRSLLTGLLSSAAVIAAGPVAKVIAIDDGFGIGPAMQALPAGPTLEDYGRFIHGKSHWLPVQFTGFSPRYDCSRDAALSLPLHRDSNVMDCGEPPVVSWATHWSATT